MAELVNSTYITLDGVIDKPETWPDLGGFGAEGNRIQADLVTACAAVLMGRHTYESFAGVFPHLAGDPVADRMNAMPKYVASTTLRDPEWNNSQVIEGDLPAEVARLKAEADGDIVQFGFGDIARTLLAAGQLDRLRLWVHPLLVGRGGPGGLLYGEAPTTRFTLEACTALESGIVVADYRVTR